MAAREAATADLLRELEAEEAAKKVGGAGAGCSGGATRRCLHVCAARRGMGGAGAGAGARAERGGANGRRQPAMEAAGGEGGPSPCPPVCSATAARSTPWRPLLAQAAEGKRGKKKKKRGGKAAEEEEEEAEEEAAAAAADPGARGGARAEPSGSGSGKGGKGRPGGAAAEDGGGGEGGAAAQLPSGLDRGGLDQLAPELRSAQGGSCVQAAAAPGLAARRQEDAAAGAGSGGQPWTSSCSRLRPDPLHAPTSHTRRAELEYEAALERRRQELEAERQRAEREMLRWAGLGWWAAEGGRAAVLRLRRVAAAEGCLRCAPSAPAALLPSTPPPAPPCAPAGKPRRHLCVSCSRRPAAGLAAARAAARPRPPQPSLPRTGQAAAAAASPHPAPRARSRRRGWRQPPAAAAA